MPALAASLDDHHSSPSSNSTFDLKSLFEKGIVLYCPVPKKRTTAESK